jgi:murein L,D-transpeptidase YafK
VQPLNRPFVRALLTSAALAATIALAGCNPDTVPTTGRALAPLSDRMVAEIADKRMDKESPILVRIFKEEAELEVWKKNQDGEFALLKTYPICRWSGDLGPKKKQGDRQAPEGFYTITPGQMNPNSNYYLAFNTGFPNTYDRSHGYTGSELMVHGDCSSRGCYAMTDEQIQEIYALARESFFGGQKEFQFEAFPFRMTALNMAKHRNNPNFAFWKMLKEGYDSFEATKQEPKVSVCEKRYVFDAAAPENSSQPLKFNAAAKCPVYRLDPAVADAVLDHRRQQEGQMADYIARDVSTVPFRVGDGGMNPVFAARLGGNLSDTDGRIYQVAGNSVPGALPRTPNRPATIAATASPPQPKVAEAPEQVEPAPPTKPVVTASVPMPHPAPLPKQGEATAQRSTVASLFGNLFHSSQADAKPYESEPLALRGGDKQLAAKPKRAAPVSTAATPAKLPPKPQPAVAPKAVAKNVPAQPKPATVATNPPAPTPELRSAYAPPASGNGLLAGAQPVVPAGSFGNSFSSLR